MSADVSPPTTEPTSLPLANFGDCVTCPVCRETFVHPFLFDECGHCLCQLCMVRLDLEAARNAPTATLPIFRCPECRSSTLLPWYRRKRNVALDFVLQRIEGHAERCRETAEELEDLLIEEPQLTPNLEEDALKPGINLSTIAAVNNIRKTARFVRDIAPIVHRAAQDGLKRVTITARARELYVFASDIAKALFKNGIYSVSCTPREFTVNILPPAADTWESEFINPHFDADVPLENN